MINVNMYGSFLKKNNLLTPLTEKFMQLSQFCEKSRGWILMTLMAYYSLHAVFASL